MGDVYADVAAVRAGMGMDSADPGLPDWERELLERQSLYEAIAREHLIRWGYDLTLDPERKQRYVHDHAEEHNLRADVDFIAEKFRADIDVAWAAHDRRAEELADMGARNRRLSEAIATLAVENSKLRAEVEHLRARAERAT